MAVALWRRCDKSCVVWGDCVSICVCISSRDLKSIWPFSPCSCWKLLGHHWKQLLNISKHLSPFSCKWQMGNCMAEGSFGTGSLVKIWFRSFRTDKSLLCNSFPAGFGLILASNGQRNPAKCYQTGSPLGSQCKEAEIEKQWTSMKFKSPCVLGYREGEAKAHY